MVKQPPGSNIIIINSRVIVSLLIPNTLDTGEIYSLLDPSARDLQALGAGDIEEKLSCSARLGNKQVLCLHLKLPETA